MLNRLSILSSFVLMHLLKYSNTMFPPKNKIYFLHNNLQSIFSKEFLIEWKFQLDKITISVYNNNKNCARALIIDGAGCDVYYLVWQYGKVLGAIDHSCKPDRSTVNIVSNSFASSYYCNVIKDYLRRRGFSNEASFLFSFKGELWQLKNLLNRGKQSSELSI